MDETVLASWNLLLPLVVKPRNRICMLFQQGREPFLVSEMYAIRPEYLLKKVGKEF